MKIVSFVTCCCPEVKERVDDSPLCGSVDNVWDSAGRSGGGCPHCQRLKHELKDLQRSGVPYPATQQCLAGSRMSQDRV